MKHQTIHQSENSTNHVPSWRDLLLIMLALAFLTLAQAAPGQDGGYPGRNTAEGSGALNQIVSGTPGASGTDNTAVGSDALFSNTTGNQNTATGVLALGLNRTADDNTADGYNALFYNTTGTQNTANGAAALESNTTGFNNTADGFEALDANTTGFNNTANGVNALFSNTKGFNNTANGFTALQNNTSGNSNTAEGDGALASNTIGSNNVAVGIGAGASLTTGSNNIDIGNAGGAGEANTIRIGTSGTQKKTFIAGISGKTVASGVGVIINSSGQLGTVQSSARFKQDIKPMDHASEALLKLKPVTFRYKEELDPDEIPQFGLIAEDVEKIDPDLVVRDEEGKVSTVRYEAVNAMLLNEFLRECRRTQQVEKDLRETIAQQQKQIEALAVGLRKVSAKIELTSPAKRTAANDQ